MSSTKLPESSYESVFTLLELSLILGSLGVVLLTSMVYSAFLLGFVPICVSLPYLLLDADFVAAAQVLIYVGAINVLIVFAVMLTNRKKSHDFFLSWTVGDGIASVICTTIFLLLSNATLNTSWSKICLVAQSNRNGELVSTDSIRRIGSELLTEFLVPFELMSIILLVAPVGAITLARKEKTTDASGETLLNRSNSQGF